MAGVTSFLYKLMSSGRSYQQIEPFAKLKMPFLGDIPLIGNALFNQDILTYGVYVLVILVALFYSRTSKGMAFAAIGENPRAAAAAGINVVEIRYSTYMFSGFMAGIGGAFLSCGIVGTFTENMSSGRGFICLAITILARWNPVFAVCAAFMFGTVEALQLPGSSAGSPLPYQFFVALPYAVTLISLVIFGRNIHAPRYLGQIYNKESR